MRPGLWRGKAGAAAALFGGLLLLLAAPSRATRVKEIGRLEGVRENQLVGYGLIVGLDGTGDKKTTGFTNRSLASLLTGEGVNLTPDDIKVKNVAAVLITADLGPYLRNGSRIDVTVSSMGDATSLQGGVLVQTPLRGADGVVYAVAQGSVSIGGFSAGSGGGNAVQKNHLLVGRVPNGALVEREVPMQMGGSTGVEIALNAPDFVTASRVAEAINRRFGAPVAAARDACGLRVTYPD